MCCCVAYSLSEGLSAFGVSYNYRLSNGLVSGEPESGTGGSGLEVECLFLSSNHQCRSTEGDTKH